MEYFVLRWRAGLKPVLPLEGWAVKNLRRCPWVTLDLSPLFGVNDSKTALSPFHPVTRRVIGTTCLRRCIGKSLEVVEAWSMTIKYLGGKKCVQQRAKLV